MVTETVILKRDTETRDTGREISDVSPGGETHRDIYGKKKKEGKEKCEETHTCRPRLREAHEPGCGGREPGGAAVRVQKGVGGGPGCGGLIRRPAEESRGRKDLYKSPGGGGQGGCPTPERTMGT